MKKYYLVPHQAMVNKNTTSIPPELLLKNSFTSRTARQGDEDTPRTPAVSLDQPSMFDQLTVQLTNQNEIDAARVVLDFLANKTSLVTWNTDGILTSPVPGLSVTVLLSYLIRQGYTTNNLDLQRIIDFHRIVFIPVQYMRNPSAINVLHPRKKTFHTPLQTSLGNPYALPHPITPSTPPASPNHRTTRSRIPLPYTRPDGMKSLKKKKKNKIPPNYGLRSRGRLPDDFDEGDIIGGGGGGGGGSWVSYG